MPGAHPDTLSSPSFSAAHLQVYPEYEQMTFSRSATACVKRGCYGHIHYSQFLFVYTQSCDSCSPASLSRNKGMPVMSSMG